MMTTWLVRNIQEVCWEVQAESRGDAIRKAQDYQANWDDYEDEADDGADEPEVGECSADSWWDIVSEETAGRP
jgi:hypothetical protein